jgi:O-antigen/teichoic acid export membrane protein
MIVHHPECEAAEGISPAPRGSIDFTKLPIETPGPSLTRTLTQKTASGVAWMSAVQVTRQVLQLVSVSILARHIPPLAYGLVAMAALVTNFLETIRDVGTGYALVREREVSGELASTVFWLNCGVGSAASLLVVALSWPAAWFFHEPQVARILQILAISFFLGAMSVVPTAMLNRAMEFRKVATAQTAAAILGTTVAVVMAISGKGVWSLVGGTVTASVVNTLVVWTFAPVRVYLVAWHGATRRILTFGLNLTGFQVLNYISRNADNLLVGRFLGSTPLGYYQMGYMLMTYPITNFATVVAQVVYPALATLRDDNERFCAAYLRTCRLIALLTFPLMLGLAVTAHPFVRVLLGAKWMPVAALLAVFGPLGAAQSIYTTTGLIYNTKGRTDLLFRWSILASTTYLVSFVVGLRWGIVGVACSYAIVWTVLMVPSFMIPFRLIDLSGKSFFRTLWPMIEYSVVMVVIAGGWRVALWRMHVQNAAIVLITTVTVGAATYMTLVLWRKPPVLDELSGLLRQSNRPALKALARLLTWTRMPSTK